ncbi:hypothetical protein ASPACDRAFT_40839 [Aspergillus aculeatus ATCC 16872]|uniref:CREG-like beta-barrel domain-containing protein n=1 Tax=Aspergillus aculeatus (strain ATCC 16872 / CBS 172.66 / WB 5094) TaxID=690307 RepID=A0A1L9X0I1_ASPA1|nr:uncharacterized protein ASPACDRAFT_40839 [Aspergillus aculeatus ATCC 16872]OJK02017.1 hypothetical protein ASPACDRAFT_40839 [Aspergillus aculeatus ATCC 16872]
MAPTTAITLYSTLALLCTTTFLNVGGASPVLDPLSSTQHLLQPGSELGPEHPDAAFYHIHPITDSPSLSPSLSFSSEEEEREAYKAPSWFESTLLARRLLALSPTGTASTIFPSPLPANSRAYAHIPEDVAGHSISLTEYLSDCEHALFPTTSSPSSSSSQENEEATGQGNPIFLALNVATTFRNTAHGSNLSLSLSWWDHVNRTEPVFPGFPLSPAGLPRVTLLGYVEGIDFEAVARSTGRDRDEVEARLTECYLRAHPDSKAWLPHRKGAPHESFWARLVVQQVYWVGGFGGLQQIGWANLSEWRGIGRWGSAGDLGDGSRRGWEGVRLPGEDE